MCEGHVKTMQEVPVTSVLNAHSVLRVKFSDTVTAVSFVVEVSTFVCIFVCNIVAGTALIVSYV